MGRIHASVAEAVAALGAAGARQEALADLVPARRSFLIRREPVLRRVGAVWRLGVFLLQPDGSLRATGALIRATPPGRPQNLSRSVEDRRSLRGAARRGGFRDGETVNFDAPSSRWMRRGCGRRAARSSCATARLWCAGVRLPAMRAPARSPVTSPSGWTCWPTRPKGRSRMPPDPALLLSSRETRWPNRCRSSR